MPDRRHPLKTFLQPFMPKYGTVPQSSAKLISALRVFDTMQEPRYGGDHSDILRGNNKIRPLGPALLHRRMQEGVDKVAALERKPKLRVPSTYYFRMPPDFEGKLGGGEVYVLQHRQRPLPRICIHICTPIRNQVPSPSSLLRSSCAPMENGKPEECFWRDFRRC